MSLKWIDGSEVGEIDAFKKWAEVGERMRKDSGTKDEEV